MKKNLYRIIAISPSAFAFPEGVGIGYGSDEPSDIEPVVAIRVSTVWQEVSPSSSVHWPVVLQLEADVWANNLDEVIDVADEVLIGFADTLAVCTNAAIAVPQTKSIFDITPGHRERDIREFSHSLGYPMLRPVRCHSPVNIDPVLKALYQARQNYKFGLAIAHYKAALGFFGTAQMIFAFESLCLSAEILAESFVVRELERRSMPFSPKSVKKLATELGHYPPSSTEVNWRNRLYDDIAVREIFDSDAELFKTVGKATNGFEHGSMPADEIRSIALGTIQLLFRKIRTAFVRLADVDFESHAKVVSWEPIGLDPVREFIDATLISSSDSLDSIGPSANLMPSLGISYHFTAVDVNEDHLTVGRTFSLQPRLGEGVKIGATRYGYSSPYSVLSTARQVRADPGSDTPSGAGAEESL